MIKQQTAVNTIAHLGAILLPSRVLFSLELPYSPMVFHTSKKINQTACISLGSKCHSYENCPHYPCKSYCKAPSWDTLITHCFRIKLGYFVLLARNPVQSLPFGA